MIKIKYNKTPRNINIMAVTYKNNVGIININTSKPDCVNLTVALGMKVGFLSIPKPSYLLEQYKQYRTEHSLLPVYAMVWSRDCDMVESEYPQKFNNGKHFRNEVDSIYDHAEGPVRITLLTKQRYLKLKHENYHYTRDRITEAWENGNGTSHYV